MTTPSALLAARAAAERRMQDWCRIERPDPDRRDRQTVYIGVCRVSAGAGEGDGGDRREVPTDAASVHLPVTESTDIRVADIITVTRALYDPALRGEYIVVAGHSKSAASARRLTCRRVS